jgi:hypothetical protein
MDTSNFFFLAQFEIESSSKLIEGFAQFFTGCWLIFFVPLIVLWVLGIWYLNFVALKGCFSSKVKLKLIVRIILLPLVLLAIGSNIFLNVFLYNDLHNRFNHNIRNIYWDPIFKKATFSEGTFIITLLAAVYLLFPMLIARMLNKFGFEKKAK